MPFTTRFWGSTAVVLCALLVQSCQPHSVSATAEEELAASPSSSTSAVRQRALGEPQAVGSLAASSAFSVAHVSPSCLMKPPSNRGEYPISPSALPSNTSASSPVANESNSLKDLKLPAKHRCVNRSLKHSNEKIRGEEEQGGQSGDPLTILLEVAELHPDKAIQFLEVLLVAAQDEHCCQQALRALCKVSEASPDMVSAYLPSLLAAANSGDEAIRLPVLNTLGKVGCFGEAAWVHYFGEVRPTPDLPEDITQILEARCPFWPERKVRDTHLLVLIPAEIDGKPFTLNLLGELIKSPKGGGSKTEYRYYHNDVQSQVGNEAPAGSYWVLLTRDVLPESRSKTYAAQKEIVAGHASRTGLSYELPKILEAATAILTHHVRNGERLYGNNPWTFTRCQELIRGNYGDYPSVVGGFESSGLNVSRNSYDYAHIDDGGAGCRKFF